MNYLRSSSVLALLSLLAIGVTFLWSIEAVSLDGLVSYLPWLLVLACPLMHLFMHGGHGHGGGVKADAASARTEGHPDVRLSPAPTERDS